MMGLKTVYSLFCDCWDLYRRYAVLDNFDDGMWDRFRDDIVRLSQKYHAEPFAREVILAVANEIERKEVER